MILGVTGHRPDKLGGWDEPNPTQLNIMERIDKFLIETRPELVLTGMSLGVDQWVAEICIYNDIPFLAAIPFSDFSSNWPERSQTRFKKLVSKAHKAICVNQGGFEKWKMHARNKWIVNGCEELLAVWNGSNGGTYSTIQYAKDIGRKIHFLDLPPNIPPPPIKKYPLSFAAGGGHGKWVEMDSETMPSMPTAALYAPPKLDQPPPQAPKPKQYVKLPPPQKDPDPKKYAEQFEKTAKKYSLKDMAKQYFNPIEEKQEQDPKTFPKGRFVDLGED